MPSFSSLQGATPGSLARLDATGGGGMVGAPGAGLGSPDSAAWGDLSKFYGDLWRFEQQTTPIYYMVNIWIIYG